MHRRTLLALLLLLAWAAVPAGAQSPAGGEILLNPSHLPGFQIPSDVACDRGGTCIVTWNYPVFSADRTFLGTRFASTTVSPAGALIREKLIAEDPRSYWMTVTTAGRRFALFWTRFLNDKDVPLYQWFDENLVPRSDMIDLPLRGESDAVRDTQPIPGGFVQTLRRNGPGGIRRRFSQLCRYQRT